MAPNGQPQFLPPSQNKMMPGTEHQKYPMYNPGGMPNPMAPNFWGGSQPGQFMPTAENMASMGQLPRDRTQDALSAAYAPNNSAFQQVRPRQNGMIASAM